MSMEEKKVIKKKKKKNNQSSFNNSIFGGFFLAFGESNLDSFIMGFRLGANFAYEAFVSTETPFQDLLKE